jgi:uncharacterized protein YggE
MEGLFDGTTGSRVRAAVFIVVIVLGLFLAVETVRGFMDLRYVGAGVSATNTINVSGYGEAFGAPDIATFDFTVSSEKTTVAAAQADATAKINAISAYLKQQGIDDKDIRTSDYSINPQYDYTNETCAAGIPCRPSTQTLRGYQVSQTTTIKVRDTAKAGDLLTGVGQNGATQVSGLSFTFDDPNKLQNDARAKAITDAKQKADLLASQLGVSLVRVVSYNDSGAYPQPYYAKDMAYSTGSGVANQAATPPSISIGQNKVTSNVNITYEIR